MKNEEIIILTIAILSPIIAFASLQYQPGIHIVPPLKDTAQYNTNDLSYPKTLMHVEERNRTALLTASVQADPFDTHLKTNPNLLHVNHRYSHVPSANIIGYAAIGTYKDNGWTGVATFFKDTTLGTCNYQSLKIMGVDIDSNVVKHDVNNKITTTSSYGNDKDGYLSTVHWYDENKDKTVNYNSLECATLTKPVDMKEIIEMANKIDIS